jgi:UDP-N-acetylmuramate: L-alanyl-gamma-D-glutamyl-meso-diaminopimelate ligase
VTRLNVHLIAIGGSGMAPFACLLQGLGHSVRGSDQPLYPPMSTLLADAGIVPQVGWDPGHLDPAPDLVVVGNAVRRDNPEAIEAERRGLPMYSMPQALGRFFLAGRRPLVIAGTHGKTTTTSMAAWVYSDAGAAPGFLVGGVPKNLGVSFGAGSGERFIIEGDEYNAAYFDRAPKFLHYRPETLVLTSAEHDHADLYPTPEALLDAYRRLVELVPPHGLVIACGDLPDVRGVVSRARAPVVFYGLGAGNDVRPADGVEPVAETAVPGRSGSRFAIDDAEDGRVEVVLPMAGDYNVVNALGVWAAARRDSLPAAVVARALGRFAGAARRQDEVGTAGGVTVVDDFAHHPTAVEQTLAGLRRRYAGRRLTVLFEPRSLTAGRSFFQQRYAAAFAGADRVLLAPVFYAGRWPAGELLDRGRLVADLEAAGVEARACADADAVLAAAVAWAAPGDVFVTMSSGSFSGLPHRLHQELAHRG